MESPIFFDKSGTRWIRAKRALAVFAVMFTGSLSWALPQISTPASMPYVPHAATVAAAGTQTVSDIEKTVDSPSSESRRDWEAALLLTPQITSSFAFFLRKRLGLQAELLM